MPGTIPPTKIALYSPDAQFGASVAAFLTGLRQPCIRLDVEQLAALPAEAPPHLLIADTEVPPSYDADANVLVLGGTAGAGGAYPHIAKPLRLGVLADLALRLARRAPVIAVGPHRLYPQARRMDKADGSSMALTEKEVDILTYLQSTASAAAPATRDNLLSAVWNYREGVTTHTLETHIYRLRQKLEQDPEAPQILLTAQNKDGEGGYYLAD